MPKGGGINHNFLLTTGRRLVIVSGFQLVCASGNNSVVECNLAKVEVASSNLVSRSIFLVFLLGWFDYCRTFFTDKIEIAIIA